MRTPIPFPPASQPGTAPPDSRGRIVNARIERDGDMVIYPRVAGLKRFADVGTGPVRGMVKAGSLLFAVLPARAVSIAAGGLVGTIGGTIGGDDPVTMAFNSRTPVPDIVVAAGIGAFVLSPSTIAAYPDPDLPGSPTSVSCFANYFMYTYADGQIFASELNSTAVNPLSYTRDTEAQGLLRGIPRGAAWYAMGGSAIGVYSDAGTSPFPLARQTTIPVGLFGKWAVAGHELGWDSAVFFVASDRTVRRLDGYTTAIVSTAAVERALQGITDPESVRACVYVERGAPIWCIASPSWTWCFDVRSGSWFERATQGRPDWQVKATANFEGRWYGGTDAGAYIHEIAPDVRDEDGEPIVARIDSTPLKDFPSPIIVDAVDVDMTTGTAPVVGAADEVAPKIMIAWSPNGGASWHGPVHRSLGRFGEHAARARVNALGRTTDRGLIVSVSWSSPVYTALRGGSADVRALLPK